MDAPRVLLEHYLKQLRLPTVLREFPKLADQCAKEGTTFEQFLLRLVEQEMLDRERRATERRITAAKFPVSKSLETYDFLAIPSLNKKLVVELARCEWIGRRENVLALGNSGTGKTHIGLALGLAACQQGFRVRFTTAAALVNELIEARDEKRLLRYQKNLARQELLIVDELGFVPLSKTGAAQRHRRSDRCETLLRDGHIARINARREPGRIDRDADCAIRKIARRQFHRHNPWLVDSGRHRSRRVYIDGLRLGSS